MVSYFEHVCGKADESDTAFVTALLLVQKKILTLTDTINEDAETGADSQTQLMQLKNRKDNQVYQVAVVDVSPARLNQIQDELAEKLFMDQPIELDDDDIDVDSGGSVDDQKQESAGASRCKRYHEDS